MRMHTCYPESPCACHALVTGIVALRCVMSHRSLPTATIEPLHLLRYRKILSRGVSMPIHVVKPGECFTRIAERYGFSDYKALYDHPDNADLKKKRPNPNVLHPGDRIVVPDKEEKIIEGLATGKIHRFKWKLV